jgi:tRNA(Ile)-lysidine synthase
MTASQPISAEEFSSLMAAVSPFETAPHVAVAVSGGGDSLSLCLLAGAWAQRHGGRVTALTVDHGLRPAAAAEAAQVGGWLNGRGIEHRVLAWRGVKPTSGLQAAARKARYDLLTSWCRETGVLHLFLAHHLEDQAETFLMRLGRGSGIDGLAAMAAVVETASVRLVRPLLKMPPERLKATLRALGQEWIEDPSNRDRNFARTRIRSALSDLTVAGISPERLAETAGHLARARLALQSAASALLARCCMIHPAGYARVDGGALAAAPKAASLRALARILVCIGGRTYGPRSAKLERLHHSIINGGKDISHCLAGCHVLAVKRKPVEQRQFLVCRERRGSPLPLAAVAGTRFLWDRRFAIEFTATNGKATSGAARLTSLGDDGWAAVAADRPDIKSCPLPMAVRPSLPALRDGQGIFAVPHLLYKRDGDDGPGVAFARLKFMPPNTISGAGFCIA